MPDTVRITDVSPRDGLQNEPGVITTRDKAALVRALCAAHVDEVEVTSFVSPKWVPQLADGPELLRDLSSTPATASVRPIFSALVPNSKGMDAAAGLIREGCPLDKVAVFTAASESFSKRNTNATIAETLERFRPVVHAARDLGLAVRGYISCAIACPFGGPIAPSVSADLAVRLAGLGCDEIDLGDTIGAADAGSTAELIRAVQGALSIESASPLLTLHLHDTFGRAAECVRAALGEGVRSFDGSVAGLGGCPFASTPGRRAPGNIDTRTLVATVRDAGLSTRVDLDRLDEAAALAQRMIAARYGTPNPAGPAEDAS